MSANPAFDPNLAASALILNGQTITADVSNAISDATIDLSITSASTLTLSVEDPTRALIQSSLLSEAVNCSIVSGAVTQSFTLVSIAKQSDTVTLTFEDALVHQLRLATATGAGYASSASPPAGYTVTPGVMSRADFAAQVYAKATGTSSTESFVTPPDGRFAAPLVSGEILTWGTSANPTEDAWTCLVRLANDVQWRCMSTGSALFFGPDAWLLTFPVVANLQEWIGGVDNIDFTWDTGQAQATATVTCPTDLLTFLAGSPVNVTNLGIANGLWLVSDMSRSLFLPDASITLAQAVPALSEAAIAASQSGANTSGAPSNPGTSGNPTVPAGTVVWPFNTKTTAQVQRVDQGWDLQNATPGAGVYAILPGIINQANADPGGFGNDYPYVTLDTPVTTAIGQQSTVYYGHVHILAGLAGTHVTAGQLIATTNILPGQNGSGASAGWLEIGFAQPGTGAPVQSGTGATAAGQAMQTLLAGVNPAGS